MKKETKASLQVLAFLAAGTAVAFLGQQGYLTPAPKHFQPPAPPVVKLSTEEKKVPIEAPIPPKERRSKDHVYVLEKAIGLPSSQGEVDDPMFHDDYIVAFHSAMPYQIRNGVAKEFPHLGIGFPPNSEWRLGTVPYLLSKGLLPDGDYCFEMGAGPKYDLKRDHFYILYSSEVLDLERLKAALRERPGPKPFDFDK